MEQQLPTQQPAPVQAIEGELHWRLSSHPITLVTFLSFRVSSLLIYLLGGLLGIPFTLIFILTILLTAADFYYLKNIAGRRLVGLRWWNEVDVTTGDSKWVFESADGRGSNGGNKTDTRFFWLALYVQPALWIAFGILAMIFFNGSGLMCVVVALILTITNTVAFSRCDKFSQASGFANRAMYSSGLARNVAGSMFSRLFSSR